MATIAGQFGAKDQIINAHFRIPYRLALFFSNRPSSVQLLQSTLFCKLITPLLFCRAVFGKLSYGQDRQGKHAQLWRTS